MSHKKISLFICAITLLSNLAYADDQAGSSLQAYKLAKQTKWSEANAEAKRATQAQPNDAEGWFILGLTEERLENLSAAVQAYEKYLSLSPVPAAAKAVENRLGDLKKRADKKAEDIYGFSSNGFFIEKSMGYTPSFVKDVNGEMSGPFGLGFRFGRWFVGYRRASGSFDEAVQVPSTNTPTVYTTVTGGGTITHQEVFGNVDISLVDPYTDWGNVQLTLPIALGGYVNTLDVGGTKYGNIGYDVGVGLALRGYTRSAFTWYVQSIYHVGIPFWGIRKAGEDNSLRNADNDDMHGNIMGLDTTVGVAFLFGSETTGHY